MPRHTACMAASNGSSLPALFFDLPSLGCDVTPAELYSNKRKESFWQRKGTKSRGWNLSDRPGSAQHAAWLWVVQSVGRRMFKVVLFVFQGTTHRLGSALLLALPTVGKGEEGADP